MKKNLVLLAVVLGLGSWSSVMAQTGKADAPSDSTTPKDNAAAPNNAADSTATTSMDSLLIVPGKSISGITLGMTSEEATGYVKANKWSYTLKNFGYGVTAMRVVMGYGVHAPKLIAVLFRGNQVVQISTNNVDFSLAGQGRVLSEPHNIIAYYNHLTKIVCTFKDGSNQATDYLYDSSKDGISFGLSTASIHKPDARVDFFTVRNPGSHLILSRFGVKGVVINHTGKNSTLPSNVGKAQSKGSPKHAAHAGMRKIKFRGSQKIAAKECLKILTTLDAVVKAGASEAQYSHRNNFDLKVKFDKAYKAVPASDFKKEVKSAWDAFSDIKTFMAAASMLQKFIDQGNAGYLRRGMIPPALPPETRRAEESIDKAFITARNAAYKHTDNARTLLG